VSSRSFLFHSSLVAIIMLALAIPARATDNPSNTSYSYARIVRLSFVSGDVQIVRTDNSNKWEPAVMNMPVEQGFAIGTNNGRAEIEFEQGSTLWLAENSVVQFTELALSNGGRITRMTLSEGTATFNTSLSAGDKFEVAAPSFRIDPANKSEFRVDLFSKDGAVRVLNGKVTVNTAKGAQEVPSGQTLAVNGKSSEVALKRSPSADEWDHWVNTRMSAKTAEQMHTGLYSDAPFTYGMADLAAYGTWGYFPGFGYGWQPWGVAAGWAPFMDGNWMMYPSLGWTWISGEPWGWVPYHFGAWQYSPAFGWMWMPGTYGMWNAAPVEWFNVGNHTAWVPAGVNVQDPRSTSVPVVVSTKALGKEGKNRAISASDIANRIQPLSAAPEPKGKRALMASETGNRHILVPTAQNLGALRAGLANPGAKINLSVLREASRSLPSVGELMPVNGAMIAPRMPSHPAARAGFSSPEMGGAGYSGPIGATASSSQSVATPTSTAHPASTAGAAGGHPR
jgi:FecR protein